jgi:hypothetical protein
MAAIFMVAAAFGAGMWAPQFGLRRVSAQGPTLNGSYGFQATVPISSSNPGLGASVGVMTFDGAGNLTINQTYVETDTAAGATALKVQPPGPITGTYTVNADSTGSLAVNLGGDKPTPFAIVVTDGGNGVMFLQTGGGNVILLGTARKN